MPKPFKAPQEAATWCLSSHSASLIEIWPKVLEDEETNDRITINPHVCHGQPCVQGTRIPVYLILRMLACGDSVEDLLQEYPSGTREDILACFDVTTEPQ